MRDLKWWQLLLVGFFLGQVAYTASVISSIRTDLAYMKRVFSEIEAKQE